MVSKPRFKVGEKVKWGRKTGEVFSYCLRGSNILDSLRMKIKDLSKYKLTIGSIASPEDRYIIKCGAKLKAYAMHEFDSIGIHHA